jgi:hypothetical protein
MHPRVRVVGKILRLVGISSPEDSIRKPAEPSVPLRGGLRTLPPSNRRTASPQDRRILADSLTR